MWCLVWVGLIGTEPELNWIKRNHVEYIQIKSFLAKLICLILNDSTDRTILLKISDRLSIASTDFRTGGPLITMLSRQDHFCLKLTFGYPWLFGMKMNGSKDDLRLTLSDLKYVSWLRKKTKGFQNLSKTWFRLSGD